MNEPLLMGVDLGTSSVKTVVVDADGRLLGSAAQEYPVDIPRPGWAEQDPERRVRAAADTMRAAMGETGAPADRVAGIGLSGQMHGTVCLDVGGRPLRSAIIWCDQRTGSQVAQAYEKIGRERLADWTGNPVAAGFMLPTWLWLREHEPETARATRLLLLPKDYLRYRLVGEAGTEPSDACGTLLFDSARRRWSVPLLDALKIDSSLLPDVHRSTEPAGALKPESAEACGLRAGVPVVFGGGDQPCQATGNGIVEAGVVSCTIGTGGQLFTPMVQPVPDPGLRLHLINHAVGEQWALMGGVLSAGLTLRWLRDNVFEGRSYQELADMAAGVGPGADGLLFLPHLIGDRTPYMDPDSRGGLVGLTLAHTRAHIVRAAMEGAVFSLRLGLDVMEELGAQPRRLVASGGATAHPLWLQLQADILGRPIYRNQTREAAAVGAALLAGIGVGVYRDGADAVRRTVRWEASVVEPRADAAARYDELYATFKKMYPALKSLRV